MLVTTSAGRVTANGLTDSKSKSFRADKLRTYKASFESGAQRFKFRVRR